jgi:hypothetical protein
MGANLPQPASPSHDPQTEHADQVSAIRDHIAQRAQRFEVRYPRAADLTAQVIAALRAPLAGVASLLAGAKCEEHFREMLRGERALPLDDLCRLAVDPTREARAAVIAALDVLERAVGRVAVPLAPPTAGLVDAAIEASEAGQEAHAEATRAIADGIVVGAECDRMLARAAHLRRAADAFEAAARSVSDRQGIAR